MRAIGETSANSKVDLSPDIITALYSILARSQVIVPDLGTPYSKFPNPDRPQAQSGDHSINDILSERQQQLDAVVHDISGLDMVVGEIKSLRRQFVEKHDKIN
ncbi:hypothetical protein M405DRAFT_845181 [Rhizopogon salebrosus TDB-379]|nr:hypothetical protein M405DRAFT_845181 [Rhizopogon salebrosus TDB-379]